MRLIQLCSQKIKNITLYFENKINENEFVIGYIGTLSDYEGIMYILECLKVLDVKFIIIGDGQIKNEIIRKVDEYNITKKVLYLGKLLHNEVIKYYNMFDIIVYPRKNCDLCQSTSSYKVFEAMSMGIPVIVSRLAAWEEIIEDGVNGLYCEPDDTEDLLQKIKLLIEDNELRKKISENTREWVVSQRDWKIMGQRMRDIYDELLITS